MISILCLCQAEGSTDNLLTEELKKGVPGSWIGSAVRMTKNVRVTSVEIQEWGNFNKTEKYWPVKIRVVGSADAIVMFDTNLGRHKFDETSDYKISKDDYGEWESSWQGKIINRYRHIIRFINVSERDVKLSRTLRRDMMNLKRILFENGKTINFSIGIGTVRELTGAILILCLGFVPFIACSDSNLDDPKVREKILAQAMDRSDLQTRRGPSDEMLLYAPNEEKPYTGWVKTSFRLDEVYDTYLSREQETMEWVARVWSVKEYSIRLGMIAEPTDEQAVQEMDLWTLQQIESGKKHGPHISWYSNLKNAEKGTFLNGIPNGLWSYYYTNGQKLGEGNRKDGLWDGLWTYWHKNGQKSSEGNCKKNWQDGLWTYWYKNGQMRSRGTYKERMQDGLWTEWYENGQIRSRGAYKKGNREQEKNGLWLSWTEKGVIQSAILEGHTDRESFGLAISPDWQKLATAGNDNTIDIWNLNTGDHLKTLTGHEYTVVKVAFSPDGRTLVSEDFGRTSSQNMDIIHQITRLWNLDTGEHIETLTGFLPKNSIPFSPDGKILVTFTGIYMNDLYAIHLWNVDTGKSLQISLAEGIYQRCISFSPDGKILASGHYKDNSIRLWNVNTRKHIKTLTGNVDSVSYLAFSPDGKILASGQDGDNPLHLWNVNTGEHLKTLGKRLKYVSSIVFSPDGKILATKDFKGSVSLWNVNTGIHLKTLTTKDIASVRNITLSPDGKTIVGIGEKTGSSTPLLRSWTLPRHRY